MNFECVRAGEPSEQKGKPILSWRYRDPAGTRQGVSSSFPSTLREKFKMAVIVFFFIVVVVVVGTRHPWRKCRKISGLESTIPHYHGLLEYTDWELENHGKIMRGPVYNIL